MKIGCLASGGKDSIYACYVAMQYGWNITSIISIKPRQLSWMYHMENIDLMPLISETMGIPLYMAESDAVKEKELDDLKNLILKAEVDGVVAGAIASEYQRTRIELICHDIGIKSFLPLWHKQQELILYDLLNAGFNVILTAVAAYGLDESWLGRTLDECVINELRRLQNSYGVSIVGEGGEFETLVLDCPLFKKRLEIRDAITTWDGSRGSYLIKKAVLTPR